MDFGNNSKAIFLFLLQGKDGAETKMNIKISSAQQ